jgi:hypothetical protein
MWVWVRVWVCGSGSGFGYVGMSDLSLLLRSRESGTPLSTRSSTVRFMPVGVDQAFKVFSATNVKNSNWGQKHGGHR